MLSRWHAVARIGFVLFTIAAAVLAVLISVNHEWPPSS
jgi:hypothetical protein